MKAWLLENQYDLATELRPLHLRDIAVPVPGETGILIKVLCCGVCHTEIDEIEGRTQPPVYPVVPGHQVVGVVTEMGKYAKRFSLGDRVGVAWIFSSCGKCEFCLKGFENLCVEFKATGKDANGGYAQYMAVDEKFAYAIPPTFLPEEAAPLLCAGAIGYRSLRLTGLRNGETLGLTGFGSSAHLVLKMTRHIFPESPVMVFARSTEEQAFARTLGASWAGDFNEVSPALCNAIIDTTPVWGTVTASMLRLKPGGRLVINAIRKESADLDALLMIRYEDHLWLEKEIKSVANITRSDVEEFFLLAEKMQLKPEIQKYPFNNANDALLDLKHKHIRGAKVLICD